MSCKILQGDALSVLRTLPDESVQCCVTSPPYWGLRNYGVDGQLGLESTPEEYVANMVAVFREVRRVLRDDGTLWLNIGDSYAGSNMTGGTSSKEHGRRADRMIAARNTGAVPDGLKPKDLVGIPWMLAFALRSDGWYLRSDIIWNKPNPMPESVTDRPTKAHEYVFLLSKSRRYYYDADAISEDAIYAGRILDYTGDQKNNDTDDVLQATRPKGRMIEVAERRNARTVWEITTQPFKESHFATMPPELARRCILAGSKPGDAILDPFGGAGTTGLVADRNMRDAVLIELNPDYCKMAEERIRSDAPLLYGLGGQA